MKKTSISKREENFSKWYNDIILEAGLGENSEVRGCMIVKPYGYSIWEKVQKELDMRLKKSGHSNAYFPIFIPKSYFNKEASHVDGFAKECAVVTHSKLKCDENNKIIIDDSSKLEEELIIRPTSETIIWNSYKKWIKSYRDLPLLINQWANVVRWEMRTRLFLRTSEFLWQEGHTAHSNSEEALKEAKSILEIYSDFIENFLCVPVVKGTKTETERFAGALETYCVEALVQDGKSIQAGTSHFLGQNFAKAFDVKFSDKDGLEKYVWATSWGVSTRLIGMLIMALSDDNGLVLPPNLAEYKIVIVPIYKSEEQLNDISSLANKIISDLEKKNISAFFDDRDYYRPGWKFNHYEARGIPIRITIGPKDLENKKVEIFRRDTFEKTSINISKVGNTVAKLLEDISKNIYRKGLEYRSKNSHYIDDYKDFKNILNDKGGFIYAHWDGTAETELKIKQETKATIRCIPLEEKKEKGKCIFSNKPSRGRVIFAKSY